MRAHRRSFVVGLTLLAVIASACGSDRDDNAADSTTTAPAAETTTAPSTDATTADSGTGTETSAPAVEETTAPAADVETFGDLPWPCGPAVEENTDDGSEVGVTADSVTIATGDDAGFVSAPGLNHEQTDAINALVDKCNELGGIHGRQIETNYYDAKIFEVATSMQAACDEGNFFLVGQGWAFDSGQEEIRLGCELPSAPTYTVSAAFAMGPLVYQGVPNPADEYPVSGLVEFIKLYPEESKKMGVLVGNFSATRETRDKVLAVGPDLGIEFVSTDLEYNTAGEADWTPFVKQLQDAGAESILWSGSCLPNLQLFMQAAVANGLDVPVMTDANHYEAKCAAANVDGALDNVHFKFAYVPFEEAADNKATQDYLDLLDASGGDTSLLGMQATSSFFLWAQASADCGATLTRECVLENMAAVNEWTSGGLHSTTDPGGNHPVQCEALLSLDGTSYERLAPAAAAEWSCAEPGIVPIVGVPALEPLLLDENRIAQQFNQ
jgi:ABC-type branched-subunit amino acid transport system substrate-binding protein